MDNTTLESQEEKPVEVAEAVEPKQPERKSRFVDEDDLLTIDLGAGDWVKIPRRFSYGFSEHFQQNTKGDDKSQIAEMLQKIIREWNLLDFGNVNIAPININNIKALEIKDLMKILEVAKEQMGVDEIPKKEQPVSEQR